MSTGEIIKKKRIEKEITQTELAETVGISKSMLCQIERGSKLPTIGLSNQIAKALECSLSELVDD